SSASRCRSGSKASMLGILIVLAAVSASGQPEPSLEALDAKSPFQRARAVQHLSDASDKRYLAELREALQDPAPLVECRALEGLARLCDKESLASVVAKLKSPYRSVRAYAIWAAGEFRDPAALDSILPFLKDAEDADLIGFALEAVSKLGSAKVQHRVTPFLRHPDRRIRDAAAQALGEIGDEGAAGDLFAQLDRENELS